MSGRNVEGFKVASVLTAQRIVGMNGTAHTVAYPANSQILPVGITIDDVESTRDWIPVQIEGKAELYMNETCASGSLIASDTSGRGIPFTPALTSTGLTTPTGVVGVLISDAVAATGTIATVLINPQLMR